MTAPTATVRRSLAQAGDRGRVHPASRHESGAWVALCGSQVRGLDIREHDLAELDALPLCARCADLAESLGADVRAGLAAFLGSGAPDAESVTLRAVPVADVVIRNAHPRNTIDEGLADSVREHGVLTPIVVTRGVAGYDLVVGARRLVAARAAGLAAIPAVVREPSPLASLVENLHREDLNPVDLAHAFSALVHKGMSIAALAKSLGLSRPHVSNTIRLLGLPREALDALAAGTITAGHGSTILAAETHEERLELTRAAVAGATVAEVAKRARRETTRVDAPDLAAALAKHLGVEVRASRDGGVTRLVLDVPDIDLPRVLAALEP